MTPAPLDADVLLAHGAFVRAVARAALGGDSEVDDVVQDTWVAAWGRSPRKPGSLRAWLAGIVRRQAAQRLRSRERDRRRNRALQERGGVPSRAPVDPVAAAERVEIGHRLVEALLALPDHYRTAVTLRYYDELPPREIARSLGIPVETARTRVRRGLVLLRSRLEEEDTQDGRNWRGSVLALLLPPLAGPATVPVAMLGGSILMKKLLLVALPLLLLLAGGVGYLALGHGIDRPDPGPAQGQEVDAGPTLVGRVPDPEESPLRGPETASPETTDPVAIFRGRVVDTEGKPIADVEILVDSHPSGLTPHREPPPGIGEILPARSAADGSFTLEAPPSTTWLPVRPRATGWASVESMFGIGIGPDSEARIVLVRACPVQVRVLDRLSRRPVVAAEVRAYTEIWTQAYDPRPGWPVDLGSTDASGAVRLQVPGGSARLVVQATRYAPAMIDVLATPDGTEHEVLLLGGGTVDLVVLDPRGDPIAGVQVTAYGPATFGAVRPTDREGRVRFENVPQRLPGPPEVEFRTHVMLRVDAEGHPVEWVTVPCPEPGASVSSELRLRQGLTLGGTVRNADGSALRRTMIFLRVHDLATRLGAPLEVSEYRVVVRDPEGTFSIDNLPPGPVDVAVHQLVGHTWKERMKIRIEVPADRDPDPLDMVVGELPGKARALPVRVLDAKGRPVEGARVDVWAFDAKSPVHRDQVTERTGNDGGITLEGVSEGPLSLLAEAPGFAPVDVRVEASDQAAEGIEVHLGDGEIRGRVVHPDGAPARVSIRLVRSIRFRLGGSGLAAMLTVVETDEEGGFLFENVADGDYGFQVHTPGVVLLSRSARGRASDEDVVLVVGTATEAAGLIVEAKVLDADTLEPIDEWVTVSLQPGGRQAWFMMLPVTGSPGLYRSDSPWAPGDYTVTTRCRGYREGRQTLRLVYGGEPPRVELRLEREDR